MPATFPANPLENDVIQLNQNKYIYRGGVWRILREPENEVVRNIFYTSDSRKLHSIDKETSLLLSFEKPTISDSSIYNRSISNTTNLPSISRHGAHVSGSEEIFAEPINYFLNDDFTISFDMFSQNDKDFDIMSFSTGSDNLGNITYTDASGFSANTLFLSQSLSGSDAFVDNSWNTFIITHSSSGDTSLYRNSQFSSSSSLASFPTTIAKSVVGSTPVGSPIDGETKLVLNANYIYDESSSKRDVTLSGVDIARRAYYFDGNGSSAAGNRNHIAAQNINLGTDDFTIEFWIKISATSGYGMPFSIGHATIQFFSFGGLDLGLYGGPFASGGFFGNSTLGQWHHIALTREGTTIRGFRDGKLISTTSVSATQSFSGTGYFGAGGGSSHPGSYALNGYMADIRISSGVARYTADFDKVVTEKDEDHILILTGETEDQSDSQNTVSFSDVETTAKYGQGSFEFSSGDAITVPGSSDFNFGTGDFTIEGWIKTSTYSYDSYARRIFLLDGPTGNSSAENFQLAFDNAGKIWLWAYNGSSSTIDQIGSITVADGEWHHFAVTRESGTIKLWVDGVFDTSVVYASSLGNLNSGSPRPQFGRYDTSQGRFVGNMTDIRISKGVARYITDFSSKLPAAILTAEDADTKLLLNVNSALQGFDIGRVRSAPTYSNMSISTSTKKFGDGAYYFDGSGKISIDPPSSDFDWSPTDKSWTWELWYNVNSGQQGGLIGTAASTNDTGGWDLYLGNGDSIGAYGGDGSNINYILTATSGKTYTREEWRHIAVSYHQPSNTLRFFNDGTMFQETTGVTFAPSTGKTLNIGDVAQDNQAFQGYIDDVRVTIGQARYTASFDVPVSELPSGVKYIWSNSTQNIPIDDFRITFSPTQNDYFIRNIKFHDKVLTEQQIKDYDSYQNNTGATHYYPLRITTNNNTYLKDLAGSVDMQASSGVIEGKNIAGTGGAYFNGTKKIDIESSELGAFQNENGVYHHVLEEPYTIESWVYVDDVNNNTVLPIFGGTAVDIHPSSLDHLYCWFGLEKNSSGQIVAKARSRKGANNYFTDGQVILQEGNWHHIALCVLDSNTAVLYVDGEKDQEGSFRAHAAYQHLSNLQPPSRFYVGYGSTSASSQYRFFEGWMDDFRISNSVKYNSSFTPPARHKIFQGNTQSRTKALPYVPLKVIKDNDYYDIESNNRNWFLRRGYSQNEVFNSPQITNNGEEFYRRSSVFPNSYTSGLVASRPSGSTETKLLFIDSEGVMQDLTPVNEVEIGDIAELEPLQSTGSLPEGKYILFASGSDIYYRDKNNITYKINTET